MKPIGAAPLLAAWSFTLLLAAGVAAAADSPLARAARLDEEILRLYWAARYAEAIPKARAALALREKAHGPGHQDVATSLQTLGSLHHMLGNYAVARSLHERALRIREQALGPAHPRVGTSLTHLAALFEAIGDYAEARSLQERALHIQEQTLGSTHPDVAASLNGLGLVLRMTGHYSEARKLYDRALRIREQALGPTHAEVAITVNDLASVAHATGDHAGARPLQERAARIHEQVLGPRHPHLASSLRILAMLLHATGDLAGARPLYERSTRIREQALGPSHPGVALNLHSLAEVLVVTGDRAKARALYERALGIARSQAAPERLWPVFVGLAATREADGQLDDALALYREGIELLTRVSAQFTDEVARTRFLEADNKLSAYDGLARLLLKLHRQEPGRGHDREALAVIDAKKGRIVADALAVARPRLQDSQARAQVEQAHAQRDRVAALEKAVAAEEAKAPAQQSRERLQNLTTLLATTKSEYLARVRPLLTRYRSLFPDQQVIDPTTPAKFAAWLPPGTLAVSFFPSPDALYLFIVASGGVFRVKSHSVTQAELFELVREYRRLVGDGERRALPWDDDGSDAYRRSVAPLKTVGARLGEHLLGPLEDELRRHTSVILMPNDLLLYLPFHALPRQDAGGQARFLAETHVVSYLTRMEQAYLRPIVEPSRDLPLIAMANPDGTLRMASREVHALKAIRSRATLLEGAQATKAAFLALVNQVGTANDLHFATHGVLDQRRPERSYLLMAGADEESQRLEIGEIRGLSLRTRLAVLSACETAVAEQTPGAALVTLAAAFSEAGAESIVASLWKVEDEAGKEVMVAFHAGLAGGDRATALQQAQLAVMRQPRTRHPFYWAPFVLIGAR